MGGIRADKLTIKVTGPNGEDVPAKVIGSTSKNKKAPKFTLKFVYEYEGEYEIVVFGPGNVEGLRQKGSPASGTLKNVESTAVKQVAAPKQLPTPGKALIVRTVTTKGDRSFIVKFAGDSKSKQKDYSADITGPSGSVIQINVENDREAGANYYQVRFVFVEEGDYVVVVRGPNKSLILRQVVNSKTGFEITPGTTVTTVVAEEPREAAAAEPQEDKGAEERKKKEAEEAERKKQEEANKKKEAEAAEKKKRDEAAQKKKEADAAAEKKRKEEEEKKKKEAEEAAKAKAEAKKKRKADAAAEKKKKEEEDKAAEEKRRKDAEEAERVRQETEKKRQEEAKLKAEEEAKNARTATFTHFCCGIQVADGTGAPKTTGGDNVTAKIDGKVKLEPKIKDLGTGQYIISFVPPEKGHYVIHVFVDGKEIAGSPYHWERQ